MTHSQAIHFVNLAAREWNDRPRRQCAEGAWFMLFSLRAMEAILPEEVRNDFLVLWSEYGGFSPSDVTRPQLDAWLNSLTERQLLRLEQRTLEFLGNHLPSKHATVLD
jgi:hypothetical protein